MKNKYLITKIINSFLLIISIFTIVGCDKKTQIEEVSINITPSATTISENETISFEVVVTGSDDKSFTWDISHPDILSHYN